MRLLLLCILVCSTTLAQEQTCLPERPIFPNYPPIARGAFVQGRVEADFDIDSKGRAQNVSFWVGHRMLQQAIRDVLEQATFPDRCFGSRHYIRYEFKLKADASSPFGQTNKFVLPDTFEIEFNNYRFPSF
ncbi:MAG: energy transducer TonB [Acidobacteriota bacterium]